MKREKSSLVCNAALVVSIIAMAHPAFTQVWQGPQIIDGGLHSDKPQIALASDGTGIAVFIRNDPGAWRAYANRWNGSGWGGATAIDAAPAQNADVPQILLDSGGSGIAVFEKNDGFNDQLEASRYVVGTGWQYQGVINPGAYNVGNPQVAVSAGGMGLVVYQTINNPGPPLANIYGNGWNGGAWIGDTKLSGTNVTEDQQVAIDPNGNGMVVFLDALPAFVYGVYASRYDATTGWQLPAQRIDGAAVGIDTDAPQISVDSNGNAMAVFIQKDGGTTWRVYANSWNGSAWAGPTTIDQSGNPNPHAPDVVLNEAGNGVAVFVEQTGGTDHVYANRYASGSWQGPEQIDGSVHSDNPRVAVDQAGNVIAVFVRNDGGIWRAYANYWDGGTWAGAAPIDPSGANNANIPQVAMDPAGNAIAVFKKSDGANDRVYANRFLAPTPTPTPTQTVMPTATPTPLIDLKPNKTDFTTTDYISITADVQPIGTPFYPYVRIIFPNGVVLYYVRDTGFTVVPTPYLGGGPFVLRNYLADYLVLATSYSIVQTGTFMLEGYPADVGGGVLGTVDGNPLTVH